VKRDVVVIGSCGSNLASLGFALKRLGVDAPVTEDPERVRRATHVILPGVGAAAPGMTRLAAAGLAEVVPTLTQPVLGICLGMQLLFEASSENEGAWGLGFLAGRVDRLAASGLKVPHIGWNSVRWTRRSELLDGLPDQSSFYFVHSYAPVVPGDDDVLGTSEYGRRFVCAVERPPLYGFQFHPEKSSSGGLRLLSNFAGICAAVRAPA
jgi:glutamine amidotransferase